MPGLPDAGPLLGLALLLLGMSLVTAERSPETVAELEEIAVGASLA